MTQEQRQESIATQRRVYLTAVFAAVILLGSQVAMAVKLIEARHEIRALRGEFATVAGDVTAHDEMLETFGDDVSVLERRMTKLAGGEGR